MKIARFQTPALGSAQWPLQNTRVGKGNRFTRPRRQKNLSATPQKRVSRGDPQDEPANSQRRRLGDTAGGKMLGWQGRNPNLGGGGKGNKPETPPSSRSPSSRSEREATQKRQRRRRFSTLEGKKTRSNPEFFPRLLLRFTLLLPSFPPPWQSGHPLILRPRPLPTRGGVKQRL